MCKIRNVSDFSAMTEWSDPDESPEPQNKINRKGKEFLALTSVANHLESCAPCPDHPEPGQSEATL